MKLFYFLSYRVERFVSSGEHKLSSYDLEKVTGLCLPSQVVDFLQKKQKHAGENWEIIQHGMSWLMRKPFEDEHIVFATYFEESN